MMTQSDATASPPQGVSCDYAMGAGENPCDLNTGHAGAHHNPGTLVEQPPTGFLPGMKSGTGGNVLRAASPDRERLDADDWHSIELALGQLPTWFPETLAKVRAIRAAIRDMTPPEET